MNSLSVNLFQHFQHQFLLNLLFGNKRPWKSRTPSISPPESILLPFFFPPQPFAFLPMTFLSATPLNSTTDRNLRSAKNDVKILSLFSESKIFCQNVACNQIFSKQFGGLLLEMFCFCGQVAHLLTSDLTEVGLTRVQTRQLQKLAQESAGVPWI